MAFTLLALAGPAGHATVPQALSIGGQLFAAGGAPITNANVNFRIQILDATETCVLYSEDHPAEDLSAAQGHFNLILGTGTSKINNVSASGTLDGKVFANGGSTAVAGCAASPLNLAAGQERAVHVLYDLGSGFVTMSPAVPIMSSAYAMVAQSLNGLSHTDFIQVNGTSALNQANEEYAFSLTNWPRLKALLDGTSSQYLTQGSATPYDMNGQRVTDVHDPTAAQDAATKHYVDTNLGGSALDVSAVGPMTGGGSALLWDQTANKWVAGAVSSSPTGAAGGDLTGTYPNPTIANDKITSAKIKSTGVAVNRLIMTDATTGANLTYGECAVAGQVYAWTATGWDCTSVATLAPVTSVAGKTGVVTLNAADISGLGTAALFDWGTAASQIVRLDASARLPAVDGSQLANVNAVQLQGRGVASTAPVTGQVLGWNGTAWTPQASAGGSVTAVASGSGLLGGPITSIGTLSVDTGTTANQILQLNASAQVPAVDGSLLSNVNAVRLQSRAIASTAPAGGQVLAWNVSASQWEPTSAATGSVTSVASGTGLLGGTITSSGTLSVDVGTAANKILQLNGTAQVPPVDGSLLTQVNAVSLQTRAVAATAPTAGQVLGWNATATRWEPTSAASGSVTSFTTGLGLLGGPVTSTGTISVDVGTAPNKIVQENANAQIAQSAGSAASPSFSFAGNAATGLYSPGANQLALSTNGTAALYVAPSGNLGVGTTVAAERLTIDAAQDTYLSFSQAGTPYLTMGRGDSGGGVISVFSAGTEQIHLDARNTNASYFANGGAFAIGTNLPQAALDVQLTGTSSAILVPRDTTANRPAGVNGMIRYNTSSNGLEGFINGSWSTLAAGSSAGTLTSLASGAGLTGGPITTSGTLSVDVGTAANKIPQLNANAQLALQGGSLAAPAYSFGASPRTGFLQSASNEVTLAINGTGAFTQGADLTASFASDVTMYQNRNADLALTVSNPINGYASNVQISSRSNYSNLDFFGTVSGVTTGWRIGMAGDTRFGLSQNGSTYPILVEKNAPSDALYLQASGRVGIGTPLPQAALDVYALGTAASALIVPRDSNTNRPAGVNGMLRYNTTSNAFEGFANNVWTPLATGTGAAGITSLASGTGLLGGPITASGTLSVDVGTAANKIVQENGNAQIAQAAGSAALPSYTFGGNPNTGLYSPGANQLAFANNGTASLLISAAGQLGVGTLSPQNTIDVVSANGASVAVTNTGGTGNAGIFASSYGSGQPLIQMNQARGLASAPTATQAYDNLGTIQFQGVGGGTNVGGVFVTATAEANFTAAAAPTALTFLTTGTTASPVERVRLTGAGNLGVGTQFPQGVLDLYSVGTSSALVLPRDTSTNRPAGVNGMIRYNTDLNAFEGYQAGGWTNLAGGSAPTFPLLASPGTTAAGTPSYSFTGNANTGLFSPGTNQLALATNGTAAVTISAAGRVGVGSATPLANLDVNGMTRVVGPGNGNATTLSADLLSGATTNANVGSTTGFPNSGYIFIESEYIAYTSKTGTRFSGLTRGALGSTATDHYSNASVYSPVAVVSGTGGPVFGVMSNGMTRIGNVTSNASLAVGDRAYASANSIGVGNGAYAFGGNGAAIGTGAETDGPNGIALGEGVRASARAGVAVGAFNAVTGTEDAYNWVATDPQFVIGIGQGGSPKTGLTMLKNGNLGIGTMAPQSLVHVTGGAIVGDSLGVSTASVDFSKANVITSSATATTINVCGLRDGGAYTLILTGLTNGAAVSVNAFEGATCATGAGTVDLGGGATAFNASGNTTILNFIYAKTTADGHTLFGSANGGFNVR